VALLSYRYWKAHYDGSPSILGRVLTFNGHPRSVIGVMPPVFSGAVASALLKGKAQLAKNTRHRTSKYLNNIMEADHQTNPGLVDDEDSDGDHPRASTVMRMIRREHCPHLQARCAE
jgi:hypothetical protein